MREGSMILPVYGEVARRRRDGGGSTQAQRGWRTPSTASFQLAVPLPVPGRI
jgi:hypothetical protein